MRISIQCFAIAVAASMCSCAATVNPPPGLYTRNPSRRHDRAKDHQIMR